MTSPGSITQTTLAQPQRLRMSYEEYLAWADEDVHAEWVNGEVIVQMPPKEPHQRVVTFLIKLAGLFIDLFHLGRLLPAPFEMRATPDGPAREPDLLFIAHVHLERLTEARLSGPADLVVEVVSDDSVARDRAEKFEGVSQVLIACEIAMSVGNSSHRASTPVKHPRCRISSM